MDMVKIIYVTAAVVLGILGGNGAVYVFNRMPAKWLTDYGEAPKEDLLQRQRLNSTPWKVIFSCLMIATGVYLVYIDPLYALGADITVFLLILVSVADAKYMIVPDEVCIALALCSAGFVKFHDKPVDILFGGLAGAGIMLAIAFIGKLIYKRETMGMGDVKLMAAVGLIAGLRGTVIIYIAASILAAMAYALLLARRRIKSTDVQPFGPYIGCGYLIYLLVLWPLQW